MIRTRVTTLLSTAVLAASLGLMLPATAHGGVITLVRFASPTGTGSTCSQPDPCFVDTAINGAPADANITIEPGTYKPAGVPISEEIQDHGSDLNIHGEAGEAPPVIYDSSNDDGIFLGNGSTLSDVTLVYSGTETGLLSFGPSVDHVAIIETNPNAFACAVFGTLTDSLCLATGTSGVAYGVEAGGNGPNQGVDSQTVRGSTIEAPGADGVGVLASSGDFTTLKTHLVNDVIHGGQADIDADTDETTAISTITVNHSDYVHAVTTGRPGTPTVVPGAGNVTTAPKFVNPATGNYQEKPNSPTINRGAADPAHDTDLAGRPRTIGKAPDMGAYESPQRPTVGHLRTTKVTGRLAKLSVPVNPNGLTTKVRFVAKRGHAHVTETRSAGAGVTTRNTKIRLKGLTPNTKYKIVVTAKNKLGAKRSNVVTFTTPTH